MTLNALLDVTPILMLIVVGVAVRASGLVDDSSRLVLTRLAYYVTIPAAIFTSIARSLLTMSMLYLSVIGFGLPVFLAGIMYLSTRRLAEQRARRGVMLCAMVVLGVFGYPFFQLFYGEAGLARMAMYDVGNSLFAGTVALWLAQTFGARPTNGRGIAWKRIVTSPVLLASLGGVVVSLVKLPVAGPVGNFLDRLALANTPLALIAVGVFLRPKAGYRSLIAQYVAIRMLLGGVLGLALGLGLGMRGVDLITACVAPTLPAGTTALVYAGNEGLDAELAAAVISVTVLIGAVTVNILPHLLAQVWL